MKSFMKKNKINGFTLVELMVVISIIGILSAILFTNFNDARMQARDKARMSSLKELQLSIELYKSQNGTYPAQGCGGATDFAGPGTGGSGSNGLATCPAYITGLVPDFISSLPNDPKFEAESDRGFYYRSNGSSYKLMLLDTVETHTVTSEGDEFARCPSLGGACASGVPATTYAVYSAGAETW
jgi:prepilin-type N-terminal cleavage/methylation domain-containing protein